MNWFAHTMKYAVLSVLAIVAFVTCFNLGDGPTVACIMGIFGYAKLDMIHTTLVDIRKVVESK